MPSSKKTVSVIIPTYNRADYIVETVQSVLRQKTGKWKMEVLVVDNGSTDNTKEVLRQFGNKIKYIKIAASGKPATPRNVGIQRSRGELIAFQDSDDIWVDNKLSQQLPVFDDPDVILCYGNAEIINEDGSKTGKLVVDSKKLKSGYIFPQLIKENFISTLTSVVRRSALEKVGDFCEDDSIFAVEDYHLWLRVATLKKSKVIAITKPLAYYRRHDRNISMGDSLDGTERVIKAYNKLWHFEGLNDDQRTTLEKQIAITNADYGHIKGEKYGDPMLSVVMSVYNGGRFLRYSIESVLNQTLQGFEFIIINDGSTDDSIDIISSFNDPRIRLIHQSNHGLVYSLNKGIELARGEFIARMDADDISLPSRFEKELGWLSANKHRGLVSTYFSHIDFEKGHPTGTTLAFPIKHIDLRRAMYITNPFAHGASMYRKQAVIEKGYYRGDYGEAEDYELWWRLAKDWGVGLVPEVLYWYRINNPGSVSQKNAESQANYVQKIIDEHWSEPFVRKRPDRILRDYNHIRDEVPAIHRHQVEDEYKVHQYSLTKALLEQGKLIQAIIMLSGMVFLSFRLFILLLKSVPRGIYFSLKRQFSKGNSL